MIAHLLVFGLATVFVVVDGLKRKVGALTAAWAIGTVLLGPIILPAYLAKRPLHTNEVREGGFAWNVLKNFALAWTVFIVVLGISIVFAVSSQTAPTSDAEAAGAAIGTALVFTILAVVWFFPMVGALVLGFFLKKSTVVERGPTGPLALEQRVA